MKLYYENNVYDWLDGFTEEYGVGFIWRRSLQHFKDIFNLKAEKSYTMPPRTLAPSYPRKTEDEPADTTYQPKD